MKVVAAESRAIPLPLARPYTIAFRTISAVEIGLVVVRDELGNSGLGTATPEAHVTGETTERCREALADLDFLVGADLGALPAVLGALPPRFAGAPAARAAVDMALHDLLGQRLGVSLGTILGRWQGSLPTSITIGIKPTDEALVEADEYVGRGVRRARLRRHQGEDRPPPR